MTITNYGFHFIYKNSYNLDVFLILFDGKSPLCS